jgi:hypothetical protein
MLRLNMAIPPARHPSALGLLGGDNAGFPNGRRLFDDVVDIAERVVAGATPFTPAFDVSPNKKLGDGVNANDRPFLPYFPFVAPPHDPLDADHHDADDDRRRGRGHWKHAQSVVDDGEEAVVRGDENEPSSDAVTSVGGPADLTMSLKGPNPSSSSRLEFTLAAESHVTLTIYDAQGRFVRTLIDQDASPGTFEARWNGLTEDGVRAEPGVYFARLVAGGQKTDRKIVLQ